MTEASIFGFEGHREVQGSSVDCQCNSGIAPCRGDPSSGGEQISGTASISGADLVFKVIVSPVISKLFEALQSAGQVSIVLYCMKDKSLR